MCSNTGDVGSMGDAIFAQEVEAAVKVLIVGNGGVGKSSMIQRYCKGTEEALSFCEALSGVLSVHSQFFFWDFTGIFTNDYKKTIGVDFLERVIK